MQKGYLQLPQETLFFFFPKTVIPSLTIYLQFSREINKIPFKDITGTKLQNLTGKFLLLMIALQIIPQVIFLPRSDRFVDILLGRLGIFDIKNLFSLCCCLTGKWE